ncbi:MAG: hypothetical protein HY547_07460 [Elusimicrobia bacterium]|nr:hypothetical protein [Elusimicrobiota bacterium]
MNSLFPRTGRPSLATLALSWALLGSLPGVCLDEASQNIPRPEWHVIKRPHPGKSSAVNPAADDLWLLTQSPAARTNAAPLVIILPMMGGPNLWAETRISRRLAERGIASAIMPLPQQFERRFFLDLPSGKLFLERDIKSLGNNMREALDDLIIAVDWIEQGGLPMLEPSWNPKLLGIAGISLGGITASLAMSRDQRIRAGAFLLAGAGLAQILAEGSETKLLAKKLNPSMEMISEQLSDLELPPPQAWANRPVLLAEARWDLVVPQSAQRRLRESIPHPQVVHLPSGHISAIAHIFWVEDEIADFFQENLK